MSAAGNWFAVIAPDIGLIFLFIALVSCTPFLVGIWYGELDLLLPMASAPAGFGILGILLTNIQRGEGETHLSVALSAVALTWLIAALIGALPYIPSVSGCRIPTAYLRRCQAGRAPGSPSYHRSIPPRG